MKIFTTYMKSVTQPVRFLAVKQTARVLGLDLTRFYRKPPDKIIFGPFFFEFGNIYLNLTKFCLVKSHNSGLK